MCRSSRALVGRIGCVVAALLSARPAGARSGRPTSETQRRRPGLYEPVMRSAPAGAPTQSGSGAPAPPFRQYTLRSLSGGAPGRCGPCGSGECGVSTIGSLMLRAARNSCTAARQPSQSR